MEEIGRDLGGLSDTKHRVIFCLLFSDNADNFQRFEVSGLRLRVLDTFSSWGGHLVGPADMLPTGA